tara:strand:+ start:49 stop:222 length:174 start_codon:yes stop_codon:yes gene_type:complete
MLSIIQELVVGLDKFHYAPRLGFKAKPKQGTLLGGLCTVFIGLVILYILGDQLHIMS